MVRTLRYAIHVGIILLCIHAMVGCDEQLSLFGPIYVDPGMGSDTSGEGTVGSPYKTIGRALLDLEVGLRSEILLMAGTYSSASGEVFPIVITEPVRMENISGSVVIRGAGSYASAGAGENVSATVVVENNDSYEIARIRDSITISNTDQGAGIWIEQSVVTLSGVGFSDSERGVLFWDSSGLVASCLIEGNSVAGIVLSNASSPRIRSCVIRNNSIGVDIYDISSPNLGTPGDYGRNMIIQNDHADLCNQSASQIQAIGNTWDDDIYSFTIGYCMEGGNIGNSGSGTVIYQGIPNNVQLFPGVAEISIQAPLSGSLIDDTQPALSWTPNGERLEYVAIFDRPPVQDQGSIVNTHDILWVWHSGLGTGTHGLVQYVDGVQYSDGAYGDGPPSPLDRGRLYYWAVWAWREGGLQISSSSSVGYFSISN